MLVVEIRIYSIERVFAKTWPFNSRATLSSRVLEDLWISKALNEIIRVNGFIFLKKITIL